jgi:hypothetical protein
MTISRAQLVKELEPGLNGIMGLELKRYGDEHLKIYTKETSSRSYEERVKASGFIAAPGKAEGGPTAFADAGEAWSTRWIHETITLGFKLTEEAIEDQQYGSLAARYTKALGRSMAYTMQVKAMVPFNSATTYLAGDGKALISQTHTTMIGQSNANGPAVAVDLNETSVEDAINTIAGWVDEKGLLVACKPKCMLVPQAQSWSAERLLRTANRVGTNDNDINVINSTNAIPGGYHINHFLTDTSKWFILTDMPDGFVMFDRIGLKTKMYDSDADTGNISYRARQRYSFGVGDPLAVWGNAAGA